VLRAPPPTTPTHPALQGALQWAESRGLEHPDEMQAVVFVTDGAPNGCIENSAAIIGLAEHAYQAHAVRTYAIGLGNAPVALLDDIAYAGGTGSAFYVSNNSQTQAELLNALKAIRGSAASCSFDLPNPDAFDPAAASVVYTSGANLPTTLVQVANAAACGTGWYYDNNASPTRVHLCPTTCTAVKADPQAQIDIELACAGTYLPLTYPERYQSTCPAQYYPQWVLLTYNATVPGDATVVFEGRTAATEDGLGAAPLHSLSTATAAAPDCGLAGPGPSCPVDFFTKLGGAPDANQPWLELLITLTPTSSGALTPTVENWQVTYSCLPAE
jgi:hypothetical protein